MTRLIQISRRSFAITLAAFGLTITAHAVNPPELDKALRQMDAASTQFRSAEANFKWDFYERVVKDTTSNTGTIYFLRKGASTDMGAQIVAPAKKTIAYSGGSLQLYDLSIDQITNISAGSNRGQIESFLTLGFGGSGKDLEKAWTITYQGNEAVQDGSNTVQTSKLDLIPKDPSVKNMFTHVTIWVDPARAITYKQFFETPSGDSRTTYFTDIRYNKSVDTKKYAIHKTSKTTVVNR